MKFGTIGAGAVALAFAREALAAGHEVVLSSRRGPDSLADKIAELGTARPPPWSRRPQASTMSCLPFPGRMSKTRCGACPRGTAEYSSTRQIRSLSTARSSCWPTWAAREQARWWLAWRRAPGCQGFQFDRHRAVQRRPCKERRPARHLRLGRRLGTEGVHHGAD